MKRIFSLLTFAFLACIGCCFAVQYDEWESYKIEFEKEYSDISEEVRKWKIWHENKKKIELHNELFDRGFVSYYKRLNMFSDMTPEEINSQYRGYQPMEPEGEFIETVDFEPLGSVPSSVDWRKKNAVTGVKQQHPCNSCYAFSTTGVIEGQLAISTGKLVSLSEQQIMDCMQPPGQGCKNGGHEIKAYNYIMRAGGIDSAASYPYRGKAQQCFVKQGRVAAKLTGFQKISPNENALLNAVAFKGPIAAGIDASNEVMHYAGGIFEGKCNGGINHAVLVVGYGVERGHAYWIVKNSWVRLR